MVGGKVVTRLSQACDKVAGTLQPCHNLTISVWAATVTTIAKGSRSERMNTSKKKPADDEEAEKLKRNLSFRYISKLCNKCAEQNMILHANF